jgi:hypothetical protein
MNRKPHIAVVGATGAVGVEMIKTLEKRNFPVGKLTLLASSRSAGKQAKFCGEMVPVQELTKTSFNGIDIALFSAGGGISKEFAPSPPGPAARDRQFQRLSAWMNRCRSSSPRSMPRTSASIRALSPIRIAPLQSL